MDEVKNQLNEINLELRNPNIESERRRYLLDLKEQLTAKLSEIYAMEMLNDRRRNYQTSE